MNGDAAPLEVADSVEQALKNVILRATPVHNGRFLSYDGEL